MPESMMLKIESLLAKVPFNLVTPHSLLERRKTTFNLLEDLATVKLKSVSFHKIHLSFPNIRMKVFMLLFSAKL